MSEPVAMLAVEILLEHQLRVVEQPTDLAPHRLTEGLNGDEPGIAPALAVAAEGSAPGSDAIASAWYRREVVAVHLRRLLLGQPA